MKLAFLLWILAIVVLVGMWTILIMHDPFVYIQFTV